MRVLLVSAVPPPAGGIATWTVQYLENCNRRNVNVSLVDTSLIGKRGNLINEHRNVLDEINRTAGILHQMKDGLSEHPDLVHINSSCSKFGIIRDFLCCRMASKKSVPYVFHCHCNVRDQICSQLGERYLKKVLSRAAYVLVLNEDSRKYICSRTDKPVRVVPNFVNDNMLSNSCYINERVKQIVFVGHVKRTKGVLEILQAARKLPDIHFTLVGSIDEEIRNASCPDNVELTGPKISEEVKGYLLRADAFLFPSYTEGFSMSLAEAMSIGLPCIVSNVGANADMIENKGGTIISEINADAISKAIDQIGDVNKRKKMARWNREKVRSSYTSEVVMKLLSEIYQEVL